VADGGTTAGIIVAAADGATGKTFTQKSIGKRFHR
jgi:hypothetical protein